MSARDDYPILDNDFAQYSRMCDEIDRLRTDNAVYENDVMPRLLDRNRLVAALDEEIRTLRAENLKMSGSHEQWLMAEDAHNAAQQVIAGLNELVGELTRHADAMRGALLEAALYAEGYDTNADWRATVEAYDDFIKEA